MTRSLEMMGRKALAAVFCVSFLLPVTLHSAVFNYAAQLDAILTKSSGNYALYAVFDPARAEFVGEQESSLSISGLQSKDGVVLWNGGGTVYYLRFYDPVRSRWINTEVASAVAADLQIANGVVAWSSSANRLVNQLVYDLYRHAWRLNQDSVAGTVTGLQVHGGVVAWNDGRIVYYRAYDPVTGDWVEANLSNASTSTNLKVKDGIVAWNGGTTAYLRTYDPALGKWVGTNVASGATPEFQIGEGMVAWATGQKVFVQVYDPTRSGWVGTEVSSGATDDLAVRHGSAVWTESDLDPIIRGYDVSSGQFGSHLTVPYASFGTSASTVTNNQTVYYFDTSLGAAGYGWAFCDGAVRFERATHHTFTGGGCSQATLTIHGPHGPKSTAATGGARLLAPTQLEDGSFQMTIQSTAGQAVTVEASGNLSDWTPIATLTNTSGTLDFIDRDATSFSRRFYRSSSAQQ